jgi:hypothetical protein
MGDKYNRSAEGGPQNIQFCVPALPGWAFIELLKGE